MPFLSGILFGKIGGVIEYTIDTDQENWNLIDEVFGGVAPTQAVDVVITNNATIAGNNTIFPAMDLRGLPSGSTLKLINNGNIFGPGGRGGTGQSAFGNDLR